MNPSRSGNSFRFFGQCGTGKLFSPSKLSNAFRFLGRVVACVFIGTSLIASPLRTLDPVSFNMPEWISILMKNLNCVLHLSKFLQLCANILRVSSKCLTLSLIRGFADRLSGFCTSWMMPHPLVLSTCFEIYLIPQNPTVSSSLRLASARRSFGISLQVFSSVLMIRSRCGH